MAEFDPLDTLLRAIKVAWDANSGSGQALENIGGPWRGERPTDDTGSFRYCTIDTPESTILGYTCSSRRWGHTVIFRLHNTTPELAAIDGAAVMDVFDPDELTLSLGNSHTLTKMRPIGIEQIPQDKERNRCSVRYEFETTVPRN